jgi:hypothetical protein
MRTKNFFRTIVAAAFCAAVSTGAFAQVTTSGTATAVKNGTVLSATANQVVDFATIGSKMPYVITNDAAYAAYGIPGYSASGFSWRLPSGGTFEAMTEIMNNTGGSFTPKAYSDKNVIVDWGAIAGDYTITVAEQSRNSLFTECAGPDSTMEVYLMPKPTANFNESKCYYHPAAADIAVPGASVADGKIGGCGLETMVIHFAVDVTGTEKFIATAQYQFTPFSTGIPGAWTAIGDSLVADAVDGGVVAYIGGGATHFYSATFGSPQSTTIDAFQFTVPTGAATYGTYQFKLTTVTDLVSRKSFKDTDGNVANGYFNASNRGDLTVGLQTLNFYSLPAPSTQPVKHVTNLNW